MSLILHHRQLGVVMILLLLAYTLYLVRSDRLSAHLAMSWIVTELAVLAILASDRLLSMIGSYFGDESALFGVLMLGATWMVFLMLDTLIRISSVALKSTLVNQELALLRERLEQMERKAGNRT